MRFIKVTESEFVGYEEDGTRKYETHTVLINPKHITYVEESDDDGSIHCSPFSNTFISCIDVNDFYVIETIEQVMMEIDKCNSTSPSKL